MSNTKDNFDNFHPIGGLPVSKMVVDHNNKPGFMYREKRTRPEDSGWRIFTGLETEEYTDDPDNTGIYSPSTILEIDPSIKEILFKGIGSVYERTEDGANWLKVTDFEMEDDYMVTHRLTEKWVIEINNLFERRIEDSGDLLYTTGDKSVRIAIWNEDDKEKDALYAEHKELSANRDETLAKTLELFDFSDNEVARTGYLVREADEEKTYSVIYGYSIVDYQVLQIAIYFDEISDTDWAIDTWKNIKLNILTTN